MTKIMVKYEKETEKQNIIKLLSFGTKIKTISKPQRTGKYYRVYIDIE